MNSIIKRVLYVGSDRKLSRQKVRLIALTELIGLITAGIFLLVFVYLFIRSGWTIITQINVGAILVILGIVGLNRLKYYRIARLLLSTATPLILLTAIFLPRIDELGDYNYFRSPEVYSILMASSVVPFLVLSIKERGLFYAGILVNFLVLIALDPLLYFFSADQLRNPYTSSRFITSNSIIVAMYLMLTWSVVFMKRIFEHFEKENEILVRQLRKKNTELAVINDELTDLNQEIKSQNEEIQAQSEELLQSQESLIQANEEISRQRRELEVQNQFLEESLDEKSRDLLITNHQLMEHNSDLHQFSYTVSHNLRSPVASIMGLINLHRQAKTEQEREEILQFLDNSAHSLEVIIRDLSRIIEIRNDKFAFMEEVSLQTEVDLIVQSLNSFIQRDGVTIRTQFEQPEIRSIKGYINSILYNLVSNAIQYRSPDRKPEIVISSRLLGENYILEVSDNGLGIDLEKYKGDLFKLYKRFHTHIQGKGLGLFIIKQQVEKLGGRIEVESAPDKGATFRIFHLKNLAL